MDQLEITEDMLNGSYVAKSSTEMGIKYPIQSDLNAELKKNTNNDEDPKNFTIPVTKKVKIRINKLLIPLKLALFIWYGAGSAVYTFIFIFFKQKGMKVTELAAIYSIMPFVQFLGPTISGIIADKLGSSKPVLFMILFLDAILMFGIVVAPDMNIMKCGPQPVNLECHHQKLGQFTARINCNILTNVTEFASCKATCSENITQFCNEPNLLCEMVKNNENESNFSLSAPLSLAYELKGECFYTITSIYHNNVAYSVCTEYHKRCSISCLIHPYDRCSTDGNGRTKMVILNVTLLILFLTVLSTSYRVMEVTCMTLVNDHNSDYGRHYFFAMTGSFTCSTFSGYLVTASALGQEVKNYKTGLYVFIGMICVLFAVISKLEIQIKNTGENLWKKSIFLLKNPDVISFAVVLLILGSACGFKLTFLYWYLEEMGASSFMLGLINGVSALYGLPFLLISNWCIKKVGTNQILILALFAYVAEAVGYFFLYDPWISLLIQAKDIITYHLVCVVVVVHSHSIAPEGLTSTTIAMASGIHFTLGQGFGSLIGGLIMNFGERMVFKVMAGSCLTTAILYSIFLYVRKKLKSSKYSV